MSEYSNIRRIFVLLSIYFITACGEDKKTAYECIPKESANSCNKDCTTDTNNNVQYSFMPDKEKNVVLEKFYVDGKISSSDVLEKCKIFDDNNWDCSSITYLEYVISERTEKMNDGVFTRYSKLIDRKNYNDRSPIEVGTCAK